MADPPAPAALLQFLGLSANTPVEVVQLEDFFRPALMDQQWHGPAERETVARFSNLVITLHKHLDDLKVYKIGRIRIDVFIIGKTRDDGIAGLITKVVET